MTDVTVVVGGQFGSEGKGAISGYLTQHFTSQDTAIRVAGPNAGHTVRDATGRAWKLRCLPVAAVTSRNCQLHIAAGSEVDVRVLTEELEELKDAGFTNVRDRLTIHPSATILHPKYERDERSLGLINRIGSTGKGIGAARAARIMREADTAESVLSSDLLSAHGPFAGTHRARILIEGTQGYGLGLNTRFYPQVTSSNCRAIDFLAMAGISPWTRDVDSIQVVVVARAYPIRVAGNSGPLHEETTWAELGLPEERTTVTNNVRRVGQWDTDLVKEALRANGGGGYDNGVTLAFTMFDHIFPEMAGRTELDDKHFEFLENLEDELDCGVEYVGTGPATVIER